MQKVNKLVFLNIVSITFSFCGICKHECWCN